MECFLDVFWSGKPTVKKDGTYKTNRVKIKIIFNKIEQFNFKEIYSDYIDDAFMKFIKIKNEEFICFATDKNEPSISILYKNIEYEELK